MNLVKWLVNKLAPYASPARNRSERRNGRVSQNPKRLGK